MVSDKKERSVLKHGFLSKRSINAVFTRWNRHYFTLDENRCFSYYGVGLNPPNKSLPLRGIFIIDRESKVSGNVKQYGEQCFVLKTAHVQAVFRAESKEKKDEWVNSLASVITEAKYAARTGSNKKETEKKNTNKLRELRRQAELKKRPQKLPLKEKNKVFQTQSWTILGHEFELDKRYSVKKIIGNGAYGVVISADDSEGTVEVAIKKIGKVFSNILDTKRILREIRLLRVLQHPTIAHSLDLMRPAPEIIPGSGRVVHDFEDIYLVMEKMDTDLQRIINSEQVLRGDHVKFILCQLLQVLVYLESANVVHRDLKPGNILINSKCQVRVADFGLARSIEVKDGEDVNVENSDMTTYVVTRWYRSPELILASGEYSIKLDVWAIGCIFGELISPDFLDQLEKITDVLGTPETEDLSYINHGSASTYMNSIISKGKPKQDWGILLKHEIGDWANDELLTQDCFDLLDELLKFNPKNRISPEDALKHDYLKGIIEQDPDFWQNLIKSDKKIDMKRIEDASLDEKELRNAVLAEISYFRSYV
eukprot:maker-scaffold_5-snap-gene-10.61-mRNA-1 protein AED:0.15 eAED:0.15 QI:156/0.5/0.66/1/1/1/3/222/538